MPTRLQIGLLLLTLAGMLFPGCARRNERPPAKPEATMEQSEAPPGPARLSPEELEHVSEAHAHYATAVIHDLNEEPEAAAEELRKAALLDAGNEELVLDVTHRLIELKQNEKAAEVLVKATEHPEASGLLYGRLGMVYSLLGQDGPAIAANRKAIEKMPQSIIGYRNLARIYLQKNEHAEGLQLLEEAAQAAGTDAGFLADLAELYVAFSRSGVTNSQEIRGQAATILNRAAELKPNNVLVIQKIGEGFAALNQPARAAEFYTQLLERFPNLPGLRQKLAGLYLREKNHEKAAEQLKAWIRQSPTDPEAHYLLGNIAFEARKMDEAADNFRRALLLNPNLEPAYYELALAQINQKQPRQALETLEKAQTKFPQSFAGEFFSGLAYASMKDYSNAVSRLVAAEVIARATDTNRLTHLFYFQLGSAYERNQQFDEAERHLRKALELSPEFSEALNYLGYMWADRGTNLIEARGMIEKALKVEPENPAYMDSMAWVLHKQGEHTSALDWQLKAVEKEKEPDPTLFDHLGDIYAALRQPEKAAEAWKKALELQPSEEIKKKLATAQSGESAGPR